MSTIIDNDQTNKPIIINIGNAGPNLSNDIFELDEKMWLTENKDRAVPDGHPDARFLLGLAGDEVPFEVAVQCGLADPPKKKRTPSKNKIKTPTKNKEGDDDGEE